MNHNNETETDERRHVHYLKFAVLTCALRIERTLRDQNPIRTIKYIQSEVRTTKDFLKGAEPKNP